jgi:sugar transferase (PEP-CTERM/EpsH1 system associated)
VSNLVAAVMNGLHVVHVVHSLGVGGLENGVANLVAAPPAGIRHSVVCLTAAGPFRERLGPAVTVRQVGKRPGHDLRAFLRLVRVLSELRPDVVHSRNWATFDAVPAARLAGVGVVVHGEHGRDVGDPDGLHPRRNRWRRRLGPLVTRFVTVSRDLRRWLVETVGIPAGKVVVICNGVDTSRFAPGDRRAARAVLGLPADADVIGTVGRLDPIKDQAGLVRAFAGIAREYPRARLVIAGDGPCRDDLERLVSNLALGDRVHLLGERRDVPLVLAAFDLFVLPSIAEGISNTLLEAMATGLPVIATRVGGNPELVEEGVNGFLVPRRDPGALQAALARYLDDPHLAVVHGKASRQSAVEEFGLERMRAAYGRLYMALVCARGAR